MSRFKRISLLRASTAALTFAAFTVTGITSLAAAGMSPTGYGFNAGAAYASAASRTAR